MFNPNPDYFHVKDEWRIEQGTKRVEGLLAHVNEEEKARVVNKQVDVVGGSRQIYELVDRNLRKGLMECSLWKETLDLYEWRRRYFTANLPWRTSWFSNAGRLNTISYQITKNFEQVVDICCCLPPLKPMGPPNFLYLGVSSVELEEENMVKRLRIENLHWLFHGGTIILWEMLFVFKRPLPDICLRYGDVVKTLFEIFARSPPRLEELAMKVVRKVDRIAPENLSVPVQRNDNHGFFEPQTFEYDIQNLDRLGQRLLERLKAVHDGIIKQEEGLEGKPEPFYYAGNVTLDSFKTRA